MENPIDWMIFGIATYKSVSDLCARSYFIEWFSASVRISHCLIFAVEHEYMFFQGYMGLCCIKDWPHENGVTLLILEIFLFYLLLACHCKIAWPYLFLKKGRSFATQKYGHTAVFVLLKSSKKGISCDAIISTAGLRWSDNEQHALPGCVPGSRLHQGLNLGLLVGGARHLPRLHHHGPLHQLPDQVPAVDVLRRLPSVPTVADLGLHPRLQVWLVVDLNWMVIS